MVILLFTESIGHNIVFLHLIMAVHDKQDIQREHSDMDKKKTANNIPLDTPKREKKHKPFLDYFVTIVEKHFTSQIQLQGFRYCTGVYDQLSFTINKVSMGKSRTTCKVI